ncbi:MAG: Cache 3/Cache 2 fusion domain-containing protein [Polyangiaceae bacterium]
MGAIFALYVTGNASTTTTLVEDSTSADVTEKTRLLVQLIGVTDKDMRRRVEALARSFRDSLPGDSEIDTSTVDIGGTKVPVLKKGGASLNLDFKAVDNFTAMTGAVATVFVRSGDEFIRVSTSLKDDQGGRVIGTQLEHDHPAYAAGLAGRSYAGLATLFGRQHMVHYDALQSRGGQTVGLVAIAVEFTAGIEALKTAIRTLKLGQTGYYYVLDARPGPTYGDFVVHPTAEGQNMLSSTDAAGNRFLRQIVDTRNGVVRYPWINASHGEKTARDKIAIFASFDEWQWVVAGSYYVDESSAGVRRLRDIMYGVGALAVLCISAVLYLFIRSLIISPLARVNKVAMAYATGDLSAEIIADRSDEVGRLTSSVNAIGVDLREIADHARERAESVVSAAVQIAQANQDLSGRTEAEASALEEAAAAMEQLSATIKRNAESARDANRVAKDASSIAAQGGAEVTRVVTTMKGIRDSSHQIGEIVEVMDGIAFQTNILALNASVEAARAGEEGRGFAVVAAEVRNLAVRSAAAAREIKGMIQVNVDRIDAGAAIVDQAGSTMTEVVRSIAQVGQIVGDISSASEEQAAGVSQLATTVNSMEKSTQQNAALVEEMSAAAESLKMDARDLKDHVAKLRTEKSSGLGERPVPQGALLPQPA